MKKAFLFLFVMAIFGIAKAQNHWTPVGGNQYNMSVSGVILIDGVEQQLTTLEVGAFCGGECRASSYAQFFPPTNQYVVVLTILSNVQSGETITFRLFDQIANQELNLDCVNTVTFESNTSIPPSGMTDWFELAFVTPTPPVTGFHFTTAGNWNTASNWQGGNLPGASDEVFIDANCTLNQDATVADLTVSSGSVLTLQTGKKLTVTGTLTNTSETGLVIKDEAQLVNASANVSATMVKKIGAYTDDSDGWYTIASPMNEMPIAGSDFLTPEFDLYRFVESNTNHDEWENYRANHPDFTTFENGRGYLYANSGNFSPAFTGTLNNATVKYDLSYTVRPDQLSGFNLIGNPFPHAIYKGSGGAIDNANLASGFYTLTNEGAWHVNTFEDAIKPGQGILVKTTAATELNIGKNTATASAETVGAKSGVGRLNICVAGDQTENRTFAYFCQGIGLNKMDNLSEQTPSLWIRDNGTDYAIAHINNDYESLDVYFNSKQSGDFTLRVDSKDTSFSYLMLVDNISGTMANLLEQNSYAFHAEGDDIEARFRLVFKVSTGIADTEEDVPFAFVHDGRIVLTGVNEHSNVKMVDLTGRIVFSEKGVNTISTSGMASGVYVLQITNGFGSRTQKIVI